MSTEYNIWLATLNDKVAEGDVFAFAQWYVKNPSPIGGNLFGEPLTRDQLAAKAFEAVAHNFKGTKVHITIAVQPGWSKRTEALAIVGPGYILQADKQVSAIFVQGAYHQVAVPISGITTIENEDI